MHVKLKGSPGIYLVGFMGCGKSTVGRSLAAKIGWAFVDLDDEIERLAGKTIPEVFEHDGEDAFRDHEHAAVLEQARLARSSSPRVVALGGGSFAFERNRRALEHAGVSIWIDTEVEVLWDRVASENHRPLARDREAFEQLLENRRDSYARADFRIDGAGTPDDVYERVGALGLF